MDADIYDGLDWLVVGNDEYRETHEMTWMLPATVLHDPSAPAPAPSATRETVARTIRSVTDLWDEPLDEVRDVPPIADALLARFTITPKEDR